MITELISTIVNKTFANFDFTFCFIINVATYVTIKILTETKRCKNINTWGKRFIFLIIALIASTVYYFTGNEIKVIFNSIILAPVSWSWIFKPICNKFKIDYSNPNNITIKD